VWALHARGYFVERLELVLYAKADRYLEREFLGGPRPLEDLRAVLGQPELARVVPHLVRFPDGPELEDDVEPGAALLFQDAIWQLARALQQEGPLPVVFGLVGGRRRTLTVDLSTTFQLLGRPQDLLVDLRLAPKYADDPASGFFFPGQTQKARVRADFEGSRWLTADQVEVSLVDVRVPRLRRALPERALGSFAAALEAGESALVLGPAITLEVDLKHQTLRFGGVVVKLVPNHMIWFATLAFARLSTETGWVDARDTMLLAAVTEHCRRLWRMEPFELSDAYDFGPHASADRHQRFNPIRTRLRRKLENALEGLPRRAEVVPCKKATKAPFERLDIPPERIRIAPALPWTGR
jgi:hypothetical protein